MHEPVVQHEWVKLESAGCLFMATVPQIAVAMQESLPDGLENYHLLALGHDEIRPRRFRQTLTSFAIADFEKASKNGFWSFWIKCDLIPNIIDIECSDRPDAQCSVNGMISLICRSHTAAWDKRNSPPGVDYSISICQSVVRADGSQVIRHDRYLALYSALRKYVTKHFPPPPGTDRIGRTKKRKGIRK